MKIYQALKVKYREIAWIVFSCGLNGSRGETLALTLRNRRIDYSSRNVGNHARNAGLLEAFPLSEHLTGV
jgi:hypothetical protein